MKKFLALVMVLALATVAIAEDRLSVNGRFNVRGTYDTADMDGDKGQKSAYDSDFRIYTKVKVDESSSVNFRFDFKDVTWGDADNTNTQSMAKGVRVERAWLTHGFSTGTKLDAGLISGGAWGTAYADSETGFWRVKLTQKISMGKVVGYVQKNVENGDITNDDSEKDDSDSYGVGAVLKAGDWNIKPLLVYTDASDKVMDNGSKGVQTTKFRFAVDGQAGPVAIEAELAYDNKNTDQAGMENGSATGLYMDANMDAGMANLGASFVWTTYDDDSGMAIGALGNDFDDYMIVMDGIGDALGYDDASGAYISGLAANIVRVYAKLTPAEKVSTDIYFTYGQDADEADIKFWEADVSAKYQFTKAFYYQAGLGYLSVDADGSDASAMRLFHKVEVAF